MKRQTLILLTALAFTMCYREATAFWGSDAKDPASGLNVAAGFDVNTVRTLTGRIAAPPTQMGPEEHAVMIVSTIQDSVSVILGPWWFWERQKFAISKGDEVTVTGSRAQGRDGSMYLFAQQIENLANGERVTLRSETGVPFWSRGASRNKSGSSGPSTRGSGSRGGSGMRGGRR